MRAFDKIENMGISQQISRSSSMSNGVVEAVSIETLQNPANSYVYGPKFRAILSAEGLAVVDSTEMELMIRSEYLPTILQVGVFNDVEDAKNFVMMAAVAYGVRMLGRDFANYFNFPSEILVNYTHYFNQRMVEVIANKKIDSYTTKHLLQLGANLYG